MAMAIVLVASFAVLAILAAGASLLANDHGPAGGYGDSRRAMANAKSGYERVRGMQATDGTLTDSCSAGDCLDTTVGSCGPCATTIFSSGDNRHRVEIDTITHPTAGGPTVPNAGTMNILVSGYYRNALAQRMDTICLSYCDAAGFDCGSDGCGGSCGTCIEPETCGGGGEEGVCGTVTSCTDIAVECSNDCVEGDTCGGGTVIDSGNNIVLIPGGCRDETGNMCDEGPDVVAKIWDNDGDYEDTTATDSTNGSNNSTALDTATNTNFEAVKFCDDMSWNGFADWYLPSQGETDYMTLAISNEWATNFDENACYWSSTDTLSTTAFSTYVSTLGLPVVCDQAKSNTYLIRCMRRY